MALEHAHQKTSEVPVATGTSCGRTNIRSTNSTRASWTGPGACSIPKPLTAETLVLRSSPGGPSVGDASWHSLQVAVTATMCEHLTNQVDCTRLQACPTLAAKSHPRISETAESLIQ